jgi:predicted metal-dependent phosphoesterase TrpH
LTVRIDLHLHTTCSDGAWDRQRLFEEIRARELEAFCVSDHDTLEAYPMPEDLRARSIAGLEVDTHFAGHTTHLLAYGVDDPASPLLAALVRQRRAREDRMLAMIGRCNALGLHVTLADVRAQATGAASLGRPHLARALVSLGAVATVQEAFDRYLADEGSGYVSLERLEARDAIALIRMSGGVSVVAHPKRLRAPEHLDELIALGVDGIEIVHPTADDADRIRFAAIADRHGLLVTGGTDFHAPVEGQPIGIDFPAERLSALRRAIDERRAAASH